MFQVCSPFTPRRNGLVPAGVYIDFDRGGGSTGDNRGVGSTRGNKGVASTEDNRVTSTYNNLSRRTLAIPAP